MARLSAARSSSPDVTALADELRNAILDIDAHATPFGTDDDGFVSGGYLISVGSLHRALGVVGHSAAKCGGCRNCWTLDQWKAEEQLLRDELEAQATRITELERWKAEALVVLGQWDEVWEALGRPGPLGSSKAVEALTEAHRLRATDPPADGPDPCPTALLPGRPHQTPPPWSPNCRGPSGLASTSRAKHLTVGYAPSRPMRWRLRHPASPNWSSSSSASATTPDRLDLP